MTKTILIVEDDPSIRVILRRMLEDEDYDAVTASNGLEAISVLERMMPDLLLLDLRMPDMDGVEFIEEFARRGWSGRTRIFVLSAQLRSLTDLGEAAAEVDDFRPKPFEVDDLLSAIESLLARPLREG